MRPDPFTPYSAVPVFAATTMPSSFARLPEPSGSFTASRMPARTVAICRASQRGPAGARSGGMSFVTPAADTIRAASRGFHSVPPLASAAAYSAIWIGVTSSAPWPIDRLQVSPSRQLSRRSRRFHSLSGTRPGRSKSRLMPVSRPKPHARAMACTASGPAASAAWKR